MPDREPGQGRRRARAAIDSPPGKVLPAVETSGRRLSRGERDALREKARLRSGKGGERRGPRLPAVDPARTVQSRGMVALGAALILVLTVLAFAGGRLFGSPDRGGGAMAPVATPLVALVDAGDAGEASGEPGRNPAPPLAADDGPRAPIVCLDPGHGGPDRGFRRGPLGALPEVEEATLVMEQASDLAARLRARGVAVVLTRERDTGPNPGLADVNGDGKTAADDVSGSMRYATLDDIQARIDICNAARADLLVSMHVNGYTTQKPFGYETWFTRERPFGNRSATFATLAYAHLKEQLRAIGYVLDPEDERGVNPDTAANVVMDHSLYKHFIITGPEVPGAVDPSRMPGAIVEALFVSNDGDASVLVSPEGANAIVTAYENAIVEYFERYPVDADE
ncbi:MAG: N-acetylmuramoyl-L-alanine amidase [Chloroflexota bacterium]